MSRNTSQIIDSKGHATRLSDSSFYDEICVFCGETDAGYYLDRPCPNGVSSGASEHWINVHYGFPDLQIQRNFAVDEPTYRHRTWVPGTDGPWTPGDAPGGKHHF